MISPSELTPTPPSPRLPPALCLHRPQRPIPTFQVKIRARVPHRSLLALPAYTPAPAADQQRHPSKSSTSTPILRNPSAPSVPPLSFRHDLLFDSGLQFRPTSSRRKRDAADQYWLAIVRELESGCTCTTLDATASSHPRLRCACDAFPAPDSTRPAHQVLPRRVRDRPRALAPGAAAARAPRGAHLHHPAPADARARSPRRRRRRFL
ncbi:hypothetical protein NUW54_g13301 [Trametes sanguinea]|uniref:Uncharacterized protein n=1 Tax=Trametes sanguinea TaxID=158606 RepID=A0ACC1MPM5_9APHY|nr:hypothetical protein NUW54_g13301 [Trametes sanguinea]